MAEHLPTGPAELGAEMDYPEHEKTYSQFVGLAKYGSLFCAALLIAMAFFFFATSAGLVNGLFSFVLFLLILVVGAYLLG